MDEKCGRSTANGGEIIGGCFADAPRASLAPPEAGSRIWSSRLVVALFDVAPTAEGYELSKAARGERRRYVEAKLRRGEPPGRLR